MSPFVPHIFRRHPIGLALALLLACTACSQDEFALRLQDEVCASVTFAAFRPAATGTPHDSLPVSDLRALIEDPAVLGEAMRQQPRVLRHFECKEAHDQPIVPAKFPVMWAVDSTAVQTEGIWRIDVLKGERLRIRFACDACATVDARGQRGPSRMSGIRHDLEVVVPGDVETPDFHLRLDARRGTLKPFEGQTFLAELVARETFLDLAAPKLQLDSKGGLYELRFTDASAYVGERFLEQLSIVMVQKDLQHKRDRIHADIERLDGEIEILRAVEETSQLATLLEKRAALQEDLAAFNPRFVVSNPAASCR